uniref:Uncharacterized protein n=1 Tax=Anguilla anguilla TaxID=7936 RepID=A0A0E9PWW5_ANGAN
MLDTHAKLLSLCVRCMKKAFESP